MAARLMVVTLKVSLNGGCTCDFKFTTNYGYHLVHRTVGDVLYLKSKRKRPDIEQSDKLTFDKLLDIVKYSLADLVKDENFAGLADEEFESMYKRKARIVDAMRNCVYGIDFSKAYCPRFNKKHCSGYVKD